MFKKITYRNLVRKKNNEITFIKNKTVRVLENKNFLVN